MPKRHYGVQLPQPFILQVLGWPIHEKEWADLHPKEFRLAHTSVKDMVDYWERKPKVRPQLKTAIKGFLKDLAETDLLEELKRHKVSLHGLVLALAYHFYLERDAELVALATSTFRQSPKKWSAVIQRMQGVMRDLHRIAAMFQVAGGMPTPNIVAGMSSPDYIPARPVEVAWQCLAFIREQLKYLGVTDRKKWQDIVDLYGQGTRGPLPAQKELEMFVALKAYFLCTTGKPRYDWIADVLNLVRPPAITGTAIEKRIDQFNRRARSDVYALQKAWEILPQFLDLN